MITSLILLLTGACTALALPQENPKQAAEDLKTFGAYSYGGYAYDVNPAWYYQSQTPTPGGQLAQDDWYSQCNASITSICYNTDLFPPAAAGEKPDTNPASDTGPPIIGPITAPSNMTNKWIYQQNPGQQCSIGYYLPSGGVAIDSAYCVQLLEQMASGVGPEKKSVNASINRVSLNIATNQLNAFPTNSSSGIAVSDKHIRFIVQP